MISKKRNSFFMICVAMAMLLVTGCNGTYLPNDEETVAAVTFSEPSGKVSIGTEIKFSCETPNVDIWYSVDKKLYPKNYSKGTKGNSYTLEKNCTIYAVAVTKNGTYGNVSSCAYTAVPKCSENSALYLGNPSNAKKDTALEENYLLEKSTYAISYNNKTHNPNWVSWHYCSADRDETADRKDSFRADQELPSLWYKVTDKDYSYNTYGFDRGHMCPNGQRNADTEVNKSVFVMTNMVPQSGENNQKVWNSLEKQEIAWAKEGKEVYIVCGPYGIGGVSDKGKFDYIKINNSYDSADPGIVVPESIWRVVLVLDEGKDDFERIDESTTVIAINVPNTTSCATAAEKAGYNEQNYWKHYITTIDAIEEMTGFDFFDLLPNEIEDVLEAKKF